MGTRSLLKFEEEGKSICCVYRHWDGYPEGRGKELAEFLNKIKVINGISLGDKAGETANGFGCLIAQWICKEKAGELGNVSVYAPDTKDVWEDFVYRVWLEDDSKIMMSVEYDDGEVLFKGEPQQYLDWLTKQEAGE